MTIHRHMDRAPLGYGLRSKHRRHRFAGAGVFAGLAWLLWLAWLGACAVGGASTDTPGADATKAAAATWVAPVSASATPPDSAPSADLTPETLAVLVSDPGAQTGRTYVVYGRTVYLYRETGTTQALAAISYRAESSPLNYLSSVILSGEPDVMLNVAPWAEFMALVRVDGPITYETIAGKTVTSPLLTVSSIVPLEGQAAS